MPRFIALVAALLIFPALTHAQVYPDLRTTTVNDYADLLTPTEEADIAAQLGQARTDTGTEINVVTLSSLRFYATDTTLEDYTTGLFNSWGVGDATANTGVLFIVFRDDQTTRIALGSGYDAADEAAAISIITRDVVPAFRDNNYAGGIKAGVAGVIDDIVRSSVTPAPATPAPTAPASGGIPWTVIGFFGVPIAVIGGLIGLNRRKQRREPCEKCGQPGLTFAQVTLEPATTTTTGRAETRKTCGACGHVAVAPVTLAMVTPNTANPTHSGGKTDGGGASGKW